MGDTPWLDAVMELLAAIYYGDADRVDGITQTITELTCTTPPTEYEQHFAKRLWQLLHIGKIPIETEG
jgi:hypothetical protein